MRQEEKLAACQLLGEAAARERKAAAACAQKGPASARERKGLAAAQMRKGGGSRADALKQMGEGRAVGGAASPTPFSNGSCFFTAASPFTSAAKWITYKGLKQAPKRNKSDNGANEGEIEDDLEEVEELPRPMGQKKTKKAAQDKKGKAKVSDSDVEELNTFGKLQSEEHANRLKVLEVQQKLSSEKLEQAKLAHLAAKEQKEAAKEQKEARMSGVNNEHV
ncbi:hypothetical protein E2562_002968 [Oryza meyeriana var. granulata]|uniref:Uncharacterized protein n=1 Tax=Oryza meyeriana var. granulata TaxID=110450 RepID=A0A6G1DDQ4_9ORYZ|nr:hypothetical protein E2562_002968 [Oryza meyeriana var. granulata]